MMSKQRKCLIVGAGMAGLTAARVLRERDWDVTVLDKGRGVGGRMATRRLGDARLDHGAQFFTVREAAFREVVHEWEQRGWVRVWFEESGHQRYCAEQGLNGLAKRLAEGLDVRSGTLVTRVEAAGHGWKTVTEAGEELCGDALILTAPAPQTLTLLDGCGAELHGKLRAIEYDPCFALLLTGEGASLVPAPGFVRPPSGIVSWIGDNVQKGITAGKGFALTVHATAEFTRLHFDSESEAVAEMLEEAASPWFAGRVSDRQLHRWRYSQPLKVCEKRCLVTGSLVVGGDAWGGPRIEGAFLSGLAAAAAIAG
ncbi:MAG: FAD-dependent oxidoreductase [Bryobacterales bacterium]|nr:FAD-dependent oxidoreductase [Bryobacterales bacterium]